MTKSKKKFPTFLVLMAVIPMLLLAIIVPLFKRSDRFKGVYAADNVDVSYSFTGSNFVSSAVLSARGTYYASGLYMASFQFSFSIDNASSIVETNSFCTLFDTYFGEDLGFYDSSTGGVVDTKSIAMDNAFHNATVIFRYKDANNFLFMPITFKVSSPSFNANISKIVFGSSISGNIAELDSHIDSDFRYNYVQYFDANGNYLLVAVTAYEVDFDMGMDVSYTKILYTTRTYYLNDPSTFTDNESYNFGYNAGYDAGYSSGNTEGNSEGYKEGYTAGQTIGYGNGYNDGLEQSGNYSFNSLIGAVIDAPVSAFTSLLNFELLGVNILGLITGLISVAIIILIVKLCMGGR